MREGLIETYIKAVRRLLPSPFTIALILTGFTLVLVLVKQVVGSGTFQPLTTIEWWSSGLWNVGLIVFAFQMMLMLVLGHILALSPSVDRLIQRVLKYCTTSANSAALVAFSTMFVGLFNWGLALIFGAIFAYKVGKKAETEGLAINYSLVGAAGYSGLMIWHGGLSGSSLIKVAEPGHLAGLMGDSYQTILPNMISLGSTVFSWMNIVCSILLLVVVPFTMYWLGKRTHSEIPSFSKLPEEIPKEETQIGAERFDNARVVSLIAGLFVLIAVVVEGIKTEGEILNFFNPNNINLLLLALCLVSHRSINAFLKATEEAISGASGILIQFPLYFGILALMNQSGLITNISDFFISISNEWTYPILTFISAGLVNIFVPSGGGQWAIQGPIIIQSSLELGVPLNKSILALAYGDQITNMLQPFWALPLLGITKLKARDILPYTLVIFLAGSLVFLTVLLLF